MNQSFAKRLTCTPCLHAYLPLINMFPHISPPLPSFLSVSLPLCLPPPSHASFLPPSLSPPLLPSPPHLIRWRSGTLWVLPVCVQANNCMFIPVLPVCVQANNCIYSCTHTLSLSHTHTQTHTHTHTHTLTHTHTHTHTHGRLLGISMAIQPYVCGAMFVYVHLAVLVKRVYLSLSLSVAVCVFAYACTQVSTTSSQVQAHWARVMRHGQSVNWIGLRHPWSAARCV